MKSTGEKGKIYNTLSPADAKKDPNAPVEPKRVEIGKDAKKEAAKDDDDDWGAVPAFLRRSRLK
jgi:hypothetical protein